VRDWWRPDLTLATALLLPASWLFGLLAAARRALYRAGLLKIERLPVPVIVVGNLIVGGSGKTPLVIALAEALAAKGYRPGVVSRGYGGASAGTAPREVSADADPAHTGDEPALIRRRTGCPLFVGADRPAAARSLLAAHPYVNVIIADDGLQHYALGRDFSIAVFDERGTGNGRLLPAGPLREPMSRTGSLDAIVVNGKLATTLPVSRLTLRMHLQADALYRLANPAQRLGVAEFITAHGTRVAAVAGIGSPARFFATLRSLGLTCEEHAFPDHHAYARGDLAGLSSPVIVMTEKDAIKCAAYADLPIWVLPVSAVLDAALLDAILEKIRGPQTA